VAVGSIVGADQAQAQFGQAVGFNEMMRPKFMRRDLVLFEEYLSLDEAQKDVLKALYDDYESSFKAGQDRFKDRMAEMKSQIDNVQDKKRILSVILTPFSQLATENEAMAKQFMDDAQLILTPDQMNEWPKFERAMRREKEINDSELAGENIDLCVHIRMLNLDAESKRMVEPVLDQYEIDLDQALINRSKAVLDTRPDLIKAFSQDDWDLYERSREKHISYHVQVRDVNDRYIDLLTNALPASYKDQFREGALEAAYPRVYRETPVQRLFNAAEKLDGISDDMRSQLSALDQLYRGELRTKNETLLAKLRDTDPKDLKDRIIYEADRFKNETTQRPGDSLRDAFLERDDLGRRYVEQVHKLLTPEQFASLPGANRLLKDPSADDSSGQQKYDSNKVESKDPNSTPRSNKTPDAAK
ncbi:MAG TPA: hypothetical protein VG711_03675, partial [Phycisphaerales bacterium]|nr:hypothetical protein [Phycisphaerales bacterium]